jgi:BirA family biotin operon repressor/biotin-[acetyl-CoA-carboxylase] ligase
LPIDPLSDLNPTRIQALLKTGRYGRSLTVVHITDSTNDDARAAIDAGAPDGHVVVADCQRAGRGSRGNTWSSPAGKDLYLSIIDRPKLVANALPLLSLAAGLGVAHAVETLVGGWPNTLVKWPNDVWLGQRKCAGILVESRSGRQAAVVIGIGLNVNRRQWSDDLAPTATSLVQAMGLHQDIDRACALCSILKEVEKWVGVLVEQGPKAIVTDLEQRLALRGARVTCDRVQGTLIGVAESGAARIVTQKGTVEVTDAILRQVG